MNNKGCIFRYTKKGKGIFNKRMLCMESTFTPFYLHTNKVSLNLTLRVLKQSGSRLYSYPNISRSDFQSYKCFILPSRSYPLSPIPLFPPTFCFPDYAKSRCFFFFFVSFFYFSNRCFELKYFTTGGRKINIDL